MRIVITGALGHIGSRLIHGLKPGDYDEVLLLDNLATQRHGSLFALPTQATLRFIEDDVCTAPLDEYFAGARAVIHLAALTGAFGEREEADAEAVNVWGTTRVAEACARTGCRLLFVSSTSAELQPLTPYAASKLKAEQAVQAIALERGLRFFIGRFATVYGPSPGMRFHTAINKFCWQAAIGQPLSVWRTALDQTRPYLDLDDAVRAIGFVIKQDLFDNSVYNVVTEHATVRMAIDAIREIAPEVEIEYVDSPMMNRVSQVVSAERFERTGFDFRGDLRSGIHRTLALLGGLQQRQPLHGPH